MMMLLLSVMLVGISFQFAGCSKMDSIIEDRSAEKGSNGSQQKTPKEGIYIMNSEGQFGRPLDNKSTDINNQKLVYYSGGDSKMSDVYRDDKFVVFSKSDIPANYKVTRYNDLGYSLGIANLSQSSDGTYFISDDNILSGSDASYKLRQLLLSGGIHLIKLNGRPMSQTSLNQAGGINGLEKGKSYKLEVYQGTFYTKGVIKADTRMIMEGLTTQTNGYSITKDGYALLNMPAMTTGYYSVEGGSVFHYIADKDRPKAVSDDNNGNKKK